MEKYKQTSLGRLYLSKKLYTNKMDNLEEMDSFL